MLLRIKEKITGWIAYVVIGLISIPFALWGINFYFQEGGDDVVLRVGEAETKLSQFNDLFLRNKRAVEENLQEGYAVNDKAIRQRVIVTLLRAHLMQQELDDYDYTVPDTQLAKYIAGSNQFQIDGVFDRGAYLQFLQASNYTQRSFEENLRDELKVQQFQEALQQSSFLTESERRELYTFLYQERDADYIVFPVEKFIDLESVPEARVQEHYEKNTAAYQTELKARFLYLDYTVEHFYPQVEVDEQELRDYYNDNIEAIVGPEKRTIAHILFNPERHGGVDAAEELAAEVYQKLEQGESFADLAAAYSDDSLTADNGGRLMEPLSRGSIDNPEIEETIFSLQLQEFSKPVLSDFGVQIFQLMATDSSITATFEQYQDLVREKLIHQRARDLYDIYFEDFSKGIFDSSYDLGPVANEFELEIQETDWVVLSQKEGLFAQPMILRAAFADDVINEELNSEVVEYADGRAIVVRMIEKEEARQQSYEEVKEEIFMEFRTQEAVKKAAEELKQIISALRDGAALQSFADEYALGMQQSGFIRRDTQSINPEIIQLIYRTDETKTTAGGKYNMGKLSNDDYVLVEVKEVRQGTADSDAPELSLFSQELDIFLQELTQTIPIYINEEALQDPNEI